METTQGPSQRQLRVGEQIRHVIIEIFQRGKFNDAVLLDAAHTITVSEVRVSPDLKNATAFVLTLGGARMGEIMPALDSASGYIQRELGKKLRLKFTPHVKFVNDTSFDQAETINRILKKSDT